MTLLHLLLVASSYEKLLICHRWHHFLHTCSWPNPGPKVAKISHTQSHLEPEKVLRHSDIQLQRCIKVLSYITLDETTGC